MPIGVPVKPTKVASGSDWRSKRQTRPVPARLPRRQQTLERPVPRVVMPAKANIAPGPPRRGDRRPLPCRRRYAPAPFPRPRAGKPVCSAAQSRNELPKPCAVRSWLLYRLKAAYFLRPSEGRGRGGLGTGGGSGIRTRDGVSPIHALQACAFNRSATPPERPRASLGDSSGGFRRVQRRPIARPHSCSPCRTRA